MTKWFWISYTLFPYPVETKVSGRIRLNFEKCFRVWYIFLKAIFCPKKEKVILKIFRWEKHPLTTISFEISILESRPPLFFNFRGGLLSSLLSKNPSKCLKTSIIPLKPQKGPKPTEIAVLRDFEVFFYNFSLGCLFQKIWWSRGVFPSQKFSKLFFLF